ncbi:MAG: hypothetical protein IKE28_09640 [Solobacterium sp.]|nr:hypothetical protein [Solobacterium sp.]
MEKAHEATNEAYIRSAYAEASADLLTNDKSTYSKEVTAKQTQAGWQGTDYVTAPNEIGGQQVTASTKGWTVAADTDENKVTITAKS